MKHLNPGACVRTAILLFATLFLSRCVAPYESARMLPKGTSEVKAGYTQTRFYDGADAGKLDDGWGVGFGYGLTDRFNLKVRYERFYSDEGRGNYLGAGPKLAIIPNRIAAALPFSLFFGEQSQTWAVSPMLLFTLPNASNTFEATFGARSDLFPEEENGLLFSFNLGFGWSKNLDQWSIRPDLGVVFGPDLDGADLCFGLGASYNFRWR